MPTGQGGMSMFMPMILIFAIFYMLVFRPQKKEQKEKQKMRGSLKKNDQVVTVGGIHGTVALTKEKTVMIRVDDNVKIEFDREAIATVISAKS
ncbi:MAG: preprotein translocase subunit YajC [Candidatus Omnitrophica bacterium]|nr:preprotein translocase subunit YajC [Candidatus Omnitrophota bacterium]